MPEATPGLRPVTLLEKLRGLHSDLPAGVRRTLERQILHRQAVAEAPHPPGDEWCMEAPGLRRVWRRCSRRNPPHRRRRRQSRQIWRSCSQRSGGWGWNGIFWRRPAVDERRTQAAAGGQTRASMAVLGVAVPDATDQPLGFPPPTGGRDAVVRLRSDGTASAARQPYGRPRAHSPPDGQDRTDTEHQHPPHCQGR